MHNIYLVDYKLVGDFFGRFSATDVSRSHHFISTVMSVAAHRRNTASTALVGRLGRSEPEVVPSLARTREVVLGILSERRAANCFRKVRHEILAYMEANALGPSEVNLMVWNGATVMGEVARSLRKDVGLRAVFFELSNLPNKVFVDPEGTNAQSHLFREPSILASYPADRENFDRWRAEFIRQKRKGSTVPQVAAGRKVGPHHVVDFIYAVTLGYRAFSWTSVRTKLANAARRVVRPATKPVIDEAALPSRYVFFPMQVSKDTQLVLNSDVDNVGALRRLAQTERLPLVVKPHPAEYETAYISKAIAGLTFNYPPVLTNGNTTALIEGAEKVVTINSTTGLEAIILGLPVEFLAPSLYAYLNEGNLASYVMEYLVDLNFFDAVDQPVPKSVLEKIYARALS
ncbi:MAG TPA: hypothetical protein VGC74_10910 [Stenotrophomonas sp.]|jgi:capsular polysaccharide export protein